MSQATIEQPRIGTQSEFNKFVGETAVSANAVNPNPKEFDAMESELTAKADAVKASEDAERADAMKDLSLYEANAQAPQTNVPDSAEGLQAGLPAVTGEPSEPAHQ